MLTDHMQIDPSLRFPGVTHTDVQGILYGAEDSLFFPGLKWGGMTADPSIFLQVSAADTYCYCICIRIFADPKLLLVILLLCVHSDEPEFSEHDRYRTQVGWSMENIFQDGRWLYKRQL